MFSKYCILIAGHLYFFCLHKITCLSIPTVLLITWNLACYFHFTFCMVDQTQKKKKKKKIYKKRNGHIGVGLSIEGGSNLLYTMIFKGWKEGLWSPELLGGLKCRGPDFKGRDLRPLFVPWSMDNYKLILSTTETAGIK